MVNWRGISSELKEFQAAECDFDDLSPLAQDTLYGSMWGLNIRYTTMEDSLDSHKEEILKESIQKVESLSLLKPTNYGVSNLLTSRQIGFGTYGWKYDRQIIETALKLNVALIDTAEGYGFGRVETELGKILKDLPVMPTNITTKVSRNHSSPTAILASARRSNEKLGMVPHYQLHFPNCAYSDTLIGRSLVRLKREGKIQSIGLGNCSVAMIESMRNFLFNYSGDVIHSVQVSYNLIDRRIESALLPYCQENGIQVIAYSPLGQSFKKLYRPVLSKLAKQYDASPAQIALAWILSKPGVIPIPRTNDLKHLTDNMEARQLQLSKSDIELLQAEYKI